MHSIGIQETHVSITPGSFDRGVDESRSVSDQSLCGGFQVRHLKRKADRSADAPAYFELVDGIRLLFVEDLQGRPAQVEHQSPSLILGPDLRWLEAEPFSVESGQALKS